MKDYMKDFDAAKIKDELVAWIRKWFEENGRDCNAVIGISGGKDSTIAAALCVEALGKDRVVGVMLPNGEQEDIEDSYEVCRFLGINSYEINIEKMFNFMIEELSCNQFDITDQAIINSPARCRMVMLRGVAQCCNGRTINTCNLSENWVGYFTVDGDGSGDCRPLEQLTVQEVVEIGKVLGLESRLVEKVPIDGLCEMTDEENLGFGYDVLDRYIRTGICEDEAIKALIDQKHRNNKFKVRTPECYEYAGPILAAD